MDVTSEPCASPVRAAGCYPLPSNSNESNLETETSLIIQIMNPLKVKVDTINNYAEAKGISPNCLRQTGT